MEQTKQIAEILDDIQHAGLRRDNPNSPRIVDNYTVADFLLLNGFRRMPVKPQTVVKDKYGKEFIVLEYTMKHDEDGLCEEVKVMHAEDKDRICFATRSMSVNEFWNTFGASIEYGAF